MGAARRPRATSSISSSRAIRGSGAFTDLALRLAAARDLLPAAEVRDAAAQVRRCFDEALPLHALDEEESVLPRLAGKDPEVDAALAEMHREHEAHGAAIGLLVGFAARSRRR